MGKLVRAAMFIAFILNAKSAFAACHVVTPTGSGSKTGADWNNAYAGLPATLIRGDLYYLADGSYGSYTFSTPVSGVTAVEIRKAQSYDNCTSVGWNTATMGSAQAIFSGGNGTINIQSSYFILNGNGTSTAPGCGGAPGPTVAASPPNVTDCGIKISDTGNSYPTINLNGSTTNQTLKYIEEVGSGDDNNDQNEIFNGNGGLTVIHAYMHNAGCVYIQDVGDNSLVDHSYFWGTEISNATNCHGQAEFEAGGTNNGVRSNNVYRDIVGTAIWTFAAGAGTNNNWQFYNNVVFNSSPAPAWNPYTSDGTFACINTGVRCTNFTFVQNTIINAGGGAHVGFNDENGNGSYIIENNLWYSNTAGTLNICCGGTAFTENFNSALNSGTGLSGAGDSTVTSGAPNPFVNWQAGNFNLASDNTAWNNRVALGAPYTVDVNGKTFTTDRGAFQYSSSQSQAPQSPTGLVATVH